MRRKITDIQKRSSAAAETQAIFEKHGHYQTSDNSIHQVDRHVGNLSVFYAGHEKICSVPQTFEMQIEFKQETSIQAFWSSGYDCILNFASAIKPGGGWLSGKQAQEESLCRSSGLGVALRERGCRAFYQGDTKTGVYSDAIIYTPNVPVIRDGDENLCAPATCAFVTCAAINARQASKTLMPAEIRSLMLKRARKVLNCAAHQGHRTIILGAWGTGVFGNNVDDIAGIFKELLDKHPCFERVLFAIPDKETFDRFQAAFVVQ